MASSPGAQIEDERPKTATQRRRLVGDEYRRTGLDGAHDEAVCLQLSQLVEEHLLSCFGQQPLQIAQASRSFEQRPHQDELPPPGDDPEGTLGADGG